MKRMLKANWLILVLFFCGSIQSLSAQTLKDVFTSSETAILYLGIDFTQARLMGDASTTGIDMRDKYFPGINDIVVNEPKRYDLAKAFNKTIINNDLGIVLKRNKKINAEDILSTNSSDYSRLTEEDINKLVKGIDFEKKKGLGLLFIMEGMSKMAKGASIWVTFIDMGTKKVLMTERIESKSNGGFSIRNYWANTIFNLIETIEKKKYKEWKGKYGN
jgi:hypothetical protein